MAEEKEAKSFETAIKELEAVVAQLESDELPLEAALERFEEGVRLTRYCTAALEAAERRIQELTRDEEGRPVLHPLEADAGVDPAEDA
ncbi:exodeoxyribonuclease VII small subunit [Dissulfurirhabdus thermomarina]|uniref:Exodeoxyribonuclease 7 small subunit n=1 Tax=Dissulfurirhabdus thermomarina TaxID=1765737 RepID=A0A6N9TLN4_DISTH|nr:exodeoxyribonuclease VII small subunit [Dissulfurirhabdus thermomarina]NDY42145.1 exodeoxyribonuclease VII small subunit [Dissulfurirhabdus thermomarina]NMX23079.1 exodeoxyribonuclease VII small subunit [Dissulfurirhabdus thermomarina]